LDAIYKIIGIRYAEVTLVRRNTKINTSHVQARPPKIELNPINIIQIRINCSFTILSTYFIEIKKITIKRMKLVTIKFAKK
jgi:hypothetical protein